MSKKIFWGGALLLPLVFLSACGTVPNQGETLQDTVMLTAPNNQQNTSLEAIYPQQESSAKDALLVDTGSCPEDKKKLSEALTVNTEALTTCEGERKKLQNLVAKSQDQGAQGKYEKFITFYLQNQKLSEFPFPKCGPVSTFNKESWYADFEAALTAEAIPFGPDTLKVWNFTGGCASKEGKMAFFLGAQQDAFEEFHLMKYDFETKKIEETILAGGNCAPTCPSKVGKRVGPYLTLLGTSEDGKNTTYRYYYAANVLQSEADTQ